MGLPSSIGPFAMLHAPPPPALRLTSSSTASCPAVREAHTAQWVGPCAMIVISGRGGITWPPLCVVIVFLLPEVHAELALQRLISPSVPGLRDAAQGSRKVAAADAVCSHLPRRDCCRVLPISLQYFLRAVARDAKVPIVEKRSERETNDEHGPGRDDQIQPKLQSASFVRHGSCPRGYATVPRPLTKEMRQQCRLS